MPFLGKQPTAGFASIVKDDLTADGSTTAFTLSKQVANANDIAVFLGNVRQEPTDAYTVSGTTLTMSEAPASGLNFYVLHIAGTVESSVVPADGTITNAKITSGISSSKLTGALPALDGSALTGAGKTLGITKFSSNTRTALSGGVDIYDYFTGNVTQVKANSKFLVHVHLIGYSDSAGTMNFDLIYDGTTHQGQAMYPYTAQTYPTVITGLYYIDGSSTTGSKAITFRQNLRSSTGKPFNVWNPNHTDDARIEQTVSNVIFIEYDF